MNRWVFSFHGLSAIYLNALHERNKKVHTIGSSDSYDSFFISGYTFPSFSNTLIDRRRHMNYDESVMKSHESSSHDKSLNNTSFDESNRNTSGKQCKQELNHDRISSPLTLPSLSRSSSPLRINSSSSSTRPVGTINNQIIRDINKPKSPKYGSVLSRPQSHVSSRSLSPSTHSTHSYISFDHVNSPRSAFDWFYLHISTELKGFNDLSLSDIITTYILQPNNIPVIKPDRKSLNISEKTCKKSKNKTIPDLHVTMTTVNEETAKTQNSSRNTSRGVMSSRDVDHRVESSDHKTRDHEKDIGVKKDNIIEVNLMNQSLNDHQRNDSLEFNTSDSSAGDSNTYGSIGDMSVFANTNAVMQEHEQDKLAMKPLSSVTFVASEMSQNESVNVIQSNNANVIATSISDSDSYLDFTISCDEADVNALE